MVRSADLGLDLGRDLERRLQQLLNPMPTRVLISPGPGNPDEAPVAMGLLKLLPPQLPLFGVCLGQQCLAAHFGLRWELSPTPVHGKAETIRHDGRGIFLGLANPLSVTRYHSLSVPIMPAHAELEPSAWTMGSSRVLMGLRHRERPWEAVQFHPESFLTEGGALMLRNFLSWT